MIAIPAWLGQRERGSRILMALVVTLTLKVGRPVGRALLYPICAYFLLFSKGARDASRAYLARALGRVPSWRERFHHYHCFAGQILDRVPLLAGDLDRFNCVIEGLDLLEAMAEQRRGALLLGAHHGSFEIMRVLADARCPVRVRVLMHEGNAEKLGSVLSRLNPGMATQVIALGRPETMLEVREALAAGEIVGMLGDRVVAGDRVRPCPFLGAVAPFPEGPYLLAAAVGVPVLLFSAIRESDGRYRIRIEPFTERVEFARDDRDAVLQRECERYAQWLEVRCREEPYNWFNFYDFWSAPLARSRH
jgi:predicted LPLAT superfamily acyltransferase